MPLAWRVVGTELPRARTQPSNIENDARARDKDARERDNRARDEAHDKMTHARGTRHCRSFAADFTLADVTLADHRTWSIAPGGSTMPASRNASSGVTSARPRFNRCAVARAAVCSSRRTTQAGAAIRRRRSCGTSRAHPPAHRNQQHTTRERAGQQRHTVRDQRPAAHIERRHQKTARGHEQSTSSQ